MKILREVTEWTECKHGVTNMDYLVNGEGQLVAVRKPNAEDWEKFNKPIVNFSRSRRKFKTLKEEEPTVFIKPFTPDPWDSASYNSLEGFM